MAVGNLINSWRLSRHHHVRPNRARPLRSAPLICLAPIPIWLLAAVFDNEVLATMAAGLGIHLGALWGWSLFRHPQLMLSFLRLGAVSLLIIMSAGWLLAQLFSLSTLGQSLSATLMLEIGTTLPAYACAVSYALAFAAMLGAFGGFGFIRSLEKNAVARLVAARQVRLSKLILLIAVICALEIWLILTDFISYRTFNVEGYDEGIVAWYLPILQIIFVSQIGLNALAVGKIVDVSRRRSRIFMTVVATSILLAHFVSFTQGRSPFILCALLHYYWTIFFMGHIPGLRKTILVALMALPILFTGTLMFNFMRSSAVSDVDIKTAGFTTFLSIAVQAWKSDQLLRAAEKKRSAENLATRPLVAHPLATSMALAANRKDFLVGQNIINSAIWSIPSIIFPEKRKYPIQENLLYANFPIGIADTADSPYLYAYADFGYFGIFIYPALLAGIWVAVLMLMRISQISSLGVLVFACIWISLFTLSVGESSMLSWFSTLRNGLISLPLIIMVANIFRFPRRGNRTKSPQTYACMQ